MTVASISNRKTYTGDNVTTSFATSPVIFYNTSDLQVRVTVIATGVSTLLTENTHYTVSGGSAAGATGTVSLAGGSSPHGALLSTEKLVILRVLPLTQASDFVNNNNSDAEVLEAALDKLTDVDQQLSERQDRALTFPEGDVSGSTTVLQDASTRAGRILGFDVLGVLTTLIVTAGTSLVDLAASTGASLIGFIQAGAGAVLRTLLSKSRDIVCVFDFMTTAQIADVQARTAALDVTAALQAFSTYVISNNRKGYLPAGTYKYTSLDWGSSVAGSGANNGFTFSGDGINSTILRCVKSPAVGNGIDMIGAAYFVIEGIEFTGGTSSANSPQVTILIGNHDLGAGSFVFTGLGVFRECLIQNYGAYALYDNGAEQVDFQDTFCQASSATSTAALVISKVNTAGIGSAFHTLKSTANSMTRVSMSGAFGGITSAGAYGVLLDEGASGIGWISFNDTFFSLTGAATIAIKDTGAGGSSLNNIIGKNLQVECSSGNNQVAVIAAGTVNGWDFSGALGTGVAQTAVEFDFTNSGANYSTFLWGQNVGGAGQPAIFFRTPVASTSAGLIVQTDGVLSTVSVGQTGNPAGGNYSIYGSNGALHKATTMAAGRKALTYSASMTPDLNVGSFIEIVPTNGTAFTINAPTNAKDGQEWDLLIQNGSGGALGAITLGAGLKATAVPAIANTLTSATRFRNDSGTHFQIGTWSTPY